MSDKKRIFRLVHAEARRRVAVGSNDGLGPL